MKPSPRDLPGGRRPSAASDAPAIGQPPVLAHDEQRAFAASVSGDAVFVPAGDIVVRPRTESGMTGGPGSPDAPLVSPGRANATLVALAVCAFLMVSNEIAPMGMLPTMALDLGRSEGQIGMAATVFALATMFATMPLARLTTHMVRRWVIVATMAFWTLGALVAAATHSYEALLASRVLTGFGHALFWAVVTPAAAGMFPAAQRGRSVARLLLGGSAAGVIGLPAETFLAQQVGWHAPFWILAAGGAVMAITIAILMPSFRTQQSTVPRGDVPSLTRFIRILVITVLTTWALSMTWTYFAALFTDVTGFAGGTIPILLFVSGVVGVAATWMVARYVDRWPVKSVALGQTLLLLLWVGLSLGIHSKVVVVAMICLQGLGWSITVVAMVNWALRHTPWTSDLGNGAYATVFNLGNAVGSRLGAVIVGVWGARWLPVGSLGLTAAALVLVLTVGGLASREGAVRRVVTAALRRGVG
jgi:predicted MFS family arabinose efflux permease